MDWQLCGEEQGRGGACLRIDKQDQRASTDSVSLIALPRSEAHSDYGCLCCSSSGYEWPDPQSKECYMILYLGIQCKHRNVRSRKTSCGNEMCPFSATASVHFPCNVHCTAHYAQAQTYSKRFHSCTLILSFPSWPIWNLLNFQQNHQQIFRIISSSLQPQENKIK
jgi:hypothetical protein